MRKKKKNITKKPVTKKGKAKLAKKAKRKKRPSSSSTLDFLSLLSRLKKMKIPKKVVYYINTKKEDSDQYNHHSNPLIFPKKKFNH